jgi:serine/threonine protein kinase/tetratricopeptide (TPR) repeat protein
MNDASPEMLSVFCGALERSNAEQRAAYLEAACGEDVEARARIEALLQAHAAAGGFLPEKAGTRDPQATTDELATEQPGTVVGQYKLLEQIGEGGFGVVFLAEQIRPVRRKVALKVLKPGMDTKQVVARFEAERQALALMDHPNIARVLDGGQTSSGRPYFVMDLVPGLPITEFCDQAQLNPRERLELFVDTCSAVQHAHQKGIIHRDLKPSNVLVTQQNNEPMVKVIDFGIAKALGQQLTDKTLFTGFAQMIGTPLYMSPEQAALANVDVDTRSDIYSLGVLLYELLTGTTPFDKERLCKVGYDEMRRIIREEEPARPSARMHTLGQGVTTVSTHRGSAPKRLSQVFRGELDWIVMKCLEKLPSRRYETASDLARDVERYLRDEPVLAGPPSARYKVRKFVWRHRGPVLVSAVVLLALVAGICAATWGLVRAERAWRAETEQRTVAEAATEEERKARETAQKRLMQIEKANAILGSIFHELDPRTGEERGLALRAQLAERLDQAARLLEGEAIGDALTVARLQDLLGRSLTGLGHYAKALPLLEQATKTREAKLGPTDLDTLQSKHNLARLYQDQGKYDRAGPLYQEVLQARMATLGADNLETLHSKNDLATLYHQQAKYKQAEALFLEVLERYTAKLGADDPHSLTCKNNLAVVYKDQGQYKEAETIYLQILRRQEKTLGPGYLRALSSKNNLALLYQEDGKHEKAELLFREVLQQREKNLGPNHPHTLTSKGCLGGLYLDQGKYQQAEALLQDVLQACNARLERDHSLTLENKHNLAALYQAQQKYGKAERLYREVMDAQSAKLGAEHPHTLISKHNLGVLYRARGRYARAERLLQEVLRSSVKTLGTAHPETIRRAFNLGVNYRDAGRLDDAVALFDEWLPRSSTTLKVGHTIRQFGSHAAAETYSRAARHAEVEPLLCELVAIARQSAGADSPTYAEHLAPLGQNLLAQHKHFQAEAVLRECLAIRQKKLPDDWVTFNTRSMLGAALLGQKRYTEAEPLLLQGYGGLKQRQRRIPKEGQVHLGDSLKRLVQLYDAWGKKDEAARWRKELEALKAPKPAQPPKKK